MLKTFRSKTVSLILIFSFVLLYSPHLINGETVGKGNLIGFVYDKDGTTPLEGAVVKLKNISTGLIFESSKTDILGAFKLEAIQEGLYVAGISSKEGDFNVESVIGIRANETAKVSFALKPQAKSKQEKKPEKKEKGEEKKGIAEFFSSPGGLVVIVVASNLIIYTLVKLTEAEPEASPFR